MWRRGEITSWLDPQAVSAKVTVAPPSCRRKIEMSPRAQSRDDTPRRRTHLLRNGMSAKRLGEGEGVKGRSRLPVRAAQPLRPSPSPSTMLQPCVRPDQVSVAPVAARRLDCGQDVEVQIGDRLERLRGRRAAQRLRQGVEPRGITGLQVDQFGDGIVPMLEAAPAVNRAAGADNDGGLLLLVARSIARLTRSIAQAALRPRIHGLLASSFSVT